jgi:molecular chaperone DnaK
MAAIVGIDLGTSNAVVAVLRGGRPTVIPNAEGERVTPCVVAFDPATESLLVGTPAKRQAITNPGNTAFSVKRFLGRRPADPILGPDVRLAPYKVAGREGDQIGIRLGPAWYSPVEISALILQKLKRDAEAYLGEPVTQAVLTVGDVPAAVESLK